MYKQQALQALRLVIVIGAFTLISLIVYSTLSFIYPILLAVLLSYFLHPFVSMLENKLKIPRAIATVASMGGFLSIVAGLAILIITEVYQGTLYLAEKVPAYFYTFTGFMEDFFNAKIIPVYEKLLSFFYTLDQDQQTAIQDNLTIMIANTASSAAEILQNMFLNIPVILTVLPNSLTVILFITLATFIITNDWSNLEQAIGRLMPGRTNQRVSTIIHYLKKALGGYFKAQLILITLTFVLIFCGLGIIGVEHALTIALFASIVDLIPYIGIGIIFIPWIIYLFLTANYTLTIGLCILYMLITVARQVLEPKILSANIGVNPLAALIGMFLGIQLWGVLGLILAPIILIMISACHQAGVTNWIWNYVKG